MTTASRGGVLAAGAAGSEAISARGTPACSRPTFSEAHNRREQAGWAREVTVRNIPLAKSIAGVNMRLERGGVREMHWHLPAEWAYMLAGTARITAVDQENRKFVTDVSGTGRMTVFAGESKANTPAELVADHLKVGEEFLRGLPEAKSPVVKT